jgi:hypothetical protein
MAMPFHGGMDFHGKASDLARVAANPVGLTWTNYTESSFFAGFT